MAECGLVRRVRTPLGGALHAVHHLHLLVAGADGEDRASVTGADDDVLRAGRAVDEVPLPQRPFLTLDDEQCLAGEHDEVLLILLPVVHGHRLAWPEYVQPDS